MTIGIKEKILQLFSEGGPYFNHTLHGGISILWQDNMNQKITMAKVIAKKRKRL